MAQHLVILCESMENNKIVVLFPCTIQNIFIMSENNSKRTSMFFAPDIIKSRFFVDFSHCHCFFGWFGLRCTCCSSFLSNSAIDSIETAAAAHYHICQNENEFEIRNASAARKKYKL